MMERWEKVVATRSSRPECFPSACPQVRAAAPAVAAAALNGLPAACFAGCCAAMGVLWSCLQLLSLLRGKAS